MATTARLGRQKISTTIAPSSFEYLDRQIRERKAQTLAEALDMAIEQLLVYENHERLAADTEAYFNNMTEEEAAEEQKLEATLSQSAAGVDFDR
jgi:chromosome condensin MukBEF MukE localization factor